MSKKSEALEKFKEYVAESESPRRLRTDNEAELQITVETRK